MRSWPIGRWYFCKPWIAHPLCILFTGFSAISSHFIILGKFPKMSNFFIHGCATVNYDFAIKTWVSTLDVDFIRNLNENEYVGEKFPFLWSKVCGKITEVTFKAYRRILSASLWETCIYDTDHQVYLQISFTFLCQ